MIRNADDSFFEPLTPLLVPDPKKSKFLIPTAYTSKKRKSRDEFMLDKHRFFKPLNKPRT